MKRLSLCCLLALLGACATTGVAGGKCASGFAGSPQFSPEDCGFRNPPDASARPGLSSWENWRRFLFEDKRGTVPVDPVPVRRVDRAALDALDPAANHVVRLGHSSHLLKLRGGYWLIDPVFGARASPVSFAGPKRFHPPPLALAEVPPIAGLVLSHDHYDHLDAPTIEALKDRIQRYFVPLGVGERLRRWGVPAERIEELDWWQRREWAGVVVTAAPAQHFSGRTPWDRNETLWSAWSLQSGAERLVYSGDTGYFPRFAEIGARLGRIDLALMENGAYDGGWPTVHMTPEETVQAFEELGARTLYPVHNSTFDLAFHGWREPLERVAALAQRKGILLATPEIGEVLTLGQARENRRWWEGLR